jgi:hypothetical protein
MSRWIYAVLIGLGVGLALGVALKNLAVGLVVGAGLFIAFAAGSTRRSRVTEPSPVEDSERAAE